MMIDRERETRADQSGSRLADGHRLPVARGIPYGKSRGYPQTARYPHASLSFTASLQGAFVGASHAPRSERGFHVRKCHCASAIERDQRRAEQSLSSLLRRPDQQGGGAHPCRTAPHPCPAPSAALTSPPAGSSPLSCFPLPGFLLASAR